MPSNDLRRLTGNSGSTWLARIRRLPVIWHLMLIRHGCRPKSYLADTGWLRSFRTRTSVDAFGKPVPWITYPALHFLSARNTDQLRVLEFGSGYSTLWWSHRCQQITSLESDANWFRSLTTLVSTTTDYQLVDTQDAVAGYPQACRSLSGPFDIVVIDALGRSQCVRNAFSHLAEAGVVIWDNSDREEDADGYQFLVRHGYKRLDFHGLGPINAYPWTTSLFYRSDNCLGI